MKTVGNAKPRRPGAPQPKNPSGVAGANQKPFRPGPLNNATDRVSYSNSPPESAEKGTGKSY